jgi:acid stress chaperone HdeB
MEKITAIILTTFLATLPAHAQVAVEVSKITCDQYLTFNVASPRDVNIWLSGYYHGKQGSTLFEPQRLKEIPTSCEQHVEKRKILICLSCRL